MKTALISGVTGMDGSILAEQLLEDGWRVVGIARRTSQPNTQNLQSLLTKKHFHLAEGDMTDAGCVHRLVKDVGPDEIYNLAAMSFVHASFQEPCHTWEVTARGALNVLEAVRATGLPCRVYQASSSEMFGSNYSVFDRDGKRLNFAWQAGDTFVGFPDPLQDEATPFAPNSPYAIAKLAAHHAVRVYRESYGIHAVAGILFNHEHQRRSEHFLTRKVTRWAGRVVAARRRGISPPRLSLGNPEARRDWGYAPDYMRAASLMLRAGTPNDYVIATGRTRSVREFLEAALAAAGLDASLARELITWENPAHLRPCEVPYLRGNPARARAELGWSSQTPFQTMVERMVRHDEALAMKEAG
jgi:GDPmannose 4,6-dehydratase